MPPPRSSSADERRRAPPTHKRRTRGRALGAGLALAGPSDQEGFMAMISIDGSGRRAAALLVLVVAACGEPEASAPSAASEATIVRAAYDQLAHYTDASGTPVTFAIDEMITIPREQFERVRWSAAV